MARLRLNQRELRYTGRNEMLNAIFEAARSFKQLTRDEEKELAKKVQSGDKVARERFINSNLRLAIAVAKYYEDSSNLPLEDLIQFGSIGLCKAVDGYTKYEEFSFITYAVEQIRKTIFDAMEKYGCTIKTTHNNFNLNQKIKKAEEVLSRTLCDEPNDADIAKFLNVSINEVQRARSSKKEFTSTNHVLAENLTIGDIIAGDMGADDEIKSEDTKTEVFYRLQKLQERERKIVMMTFGIGYDYEMSPDIIGNKLGLFTERVRQIYKGAMKKLQQSL